MSPFMDRDCVRCGCKMFSQKARLAATPAERAEWKALGARRVGGRGLCSACVEYLKKHGGLDGYATMGQAVEPRPCARCGITHGRSHRLCDDCHSVVADLGELERWSA